MRRFSLSLLLGAALALGNVNLVVAQDAKLCDCVQCDEDCISNISYYSRGGGGGGGGPVDDGGYVGDDGDVDFVTDGLAAAGPSLVPNMIGDSLNGGGVVTHMGSGLSQERVSLFSFHQFKISEDESPIPRSRFYFDVNDYSNAPGLDSITRLMVGVEKAFANDMWSIGLRLPIWLVDVEGTPAGGALPIVAPFGEGGNSNNIGDLTVTVKAAMVRCCDRVLTGGISVTTPTGPDTLGGVEPYYTFDRVKHRGAIQPWFGWYQALGSQGLFTQGFAAFDLPFDREDADYFYLDIGTGYRMPRCGGAITAITPIVEAHWAAPLNDKEQPYTLTPLGTATLGGTFIGTLAYRHQVNITAAVNLEIQNNKSLAIGFVVPTVGPRVMDFELVAQINVFGW